MKFFLTLASCLMIPIFYINEFNKNKYSLFLDRVAENSFIFKNQDLVFNKSGTSFTIKNTQLNSYKTFSLVSIYSSSKAVYQLENSYLGILLIDASLYTTQMTDSLLKINFNNITLAGNQRRIF